MLSKIEGNERNSDCNMMYEEDMKQPQWLWV